MNKRIVKIGRNILFMLSVPAIICAFVFADVSTRNEICRGVQVSFKNNQLSFVTKQNISNILEANGIVAGKTPLRKIQVSKLERAIENNKWVKNADIFVSADNRIHIRIEQKTPVVRIQPDNDFEEPYYLDAYGNIIFYSEQYIPDLPVVTTPPIGYTSADISLKSDIVKLSEFISKDTFWSAAITQIVVDSGRSISLIPAFGTQQIILGNVDGLENKMSKLFQFYKQGYHTVNWDKYDEIDLRFERQVVCRNTRGEKISVDPYDKSTHKDILAIAKANEEKKKADEAITAHAGSGSVVTAAPVHTTASPVVAHTSVAAKPKAPAKETPKPQRAVTKEKTTVSKVADAAVQKPANKAVSANAVKALAAKETPKAKPAAKETKPVMTEVQNSKYFK